MVKMPLPLEILIMAGIKLTLEKINSSLEPTWLGGRIPTDLDREFPTETCRESLRG